MTDPGWSKLYYSVDELKQFSVKKSRVFGDLRLETEIDEVRYRYWLTDSGVVFIDTLDKQGAWRHFFAYNGYEMGEQPSGQKPL
jgi:hypothetical protein